jgi:hypothetical protein
MELLELPDQSTLILACHFTGIFDVNRQSVLMDDDFSLVQNWVDSILNLDLTAVLFHNNFSENTCAQHAHPNLHFIRVEFPNTFNPNVFRYFVYQEFIELHLAQVSAFFVTDVGDVTVCLNPFVQPLFLNNPNALFCGDEPKTLQNDWMYEHGTHFRAQMPDYAAFEAEFANAPLLNCGVFGGITLVMRAFLAGLCAVHARFNDDNRTAFTGDMGAFNYCVRRHWNDRVLHGAPVNTVFKGYEVDRRDCWFRHK